MNNSPLLDFNLLSIRNMVSADLTEVLAIERHVHVSPWARLSFDESLNKDYLCRVIEDTQQQKVIAYLIVCPVADELHILNIAAAPQFQGLGLGHMLMQEIIDLANRENLRKIFLEVRVSNEIAQNLYLKWQFNQIAIRKRYYSVPNSSNTSQREDALVFVRQLPK